MAFNSGAKNAAKVGAGAQADFVNNYFLAGRQSSPGKGCIFLSDESQNTKIFVAGNVSSLSPPGTEDPWLNVTSYDLVAGKSIERRPAPLSFRSMQPFSIAPMVTLTAKQAYETVIARVGTKIRDTDDRRLIQSVKQRTGNVGRVDP